MQKNTYDQGRYKYVKQRLNKRQRTPKVQPRMNNPEKMATLCTQDKEGGQTKQKTQHRKLKIELKNK